MSTPARALPAVPARRARPRPLRAPVAPEAPWLGLLAFLIGLALGAYLTLHLGYMSYDAVSRIGHAYYVLFSRDPHLGAIGFIWTPLSSIAALPLVAFYPWWPALVSRGVAGIVLSAGAQGLGVYYLTRLLGRWGWSRGWRLVLAAAYLFNPLTLLYSANGMTDIMLATSVIATYEAVAAFLAEGRSAALAGAGLWLAAGFGVRYEAVPFGLMVAVGLAVGLAVAARDPGRWQRAEGAALLVLTPLVYAGSLWIYFNWLIMKNPLYFLDGNYSNLAQTGLSRYEQVIRAHEMGHPLAVLQYTAHFTLLFWPFGLAFLAVLLLFIRGRADAMAPVLLAGSLGIPLLDMLMLEAGHLAPWDRYFLYFIPNGLLLLGYAGSRLRSGIGTRRTAVALAAAVLALAGSAGTFFALKSPMLGDPDGTIIASALAGRRMPSLNAGARSLVSYIDRHPRMTILTDEFISGVSVVIQARNLRQFVITPDYDFQSILDNPRGRVDAFLVPQPIGGAKLDAVNEAWPGLWYGRVPWAHLVRTFPNVAGVTYRMFRIGSSAP